MSSAGQVFIKPGIGNNIQTTDVILIAANSRAVTGITRANTSRGKAAQLPPTDNEAVRTCDLFAKTINITRLTIKAEDHAVEVEGVEILARSVVLA